MPAAGSCRVCSHPKRDEIDLRLGAGESERSVALAVGLPRGTIHVHRARCQRKAAARPEKATRAEGPTPERRELELRPVSLPPDDPQAVLLSELQDVHRKALGAFDRAADRMDDRTIALLVQQLRNNLKAQSDIMAKAHRDDREPAERLRDNPEWVAGKVRLVRAAGRCCLGCKTELIAALEEPE